MGGGCSGKAAAPCPVCVDSGQDGVDAHVRRWNWEFRCEAPPDATPRPGARTSSRRRIGSSSRSLQQSGTRALPVPSTALHQPAQQAYLQVSIVDIGAVCNHIRFCALLLFWCMFLYTKRPLLFHTAWSIPNILSYYFTISSSLHEKQVKMNALRLPRRRADMWCRNKGAALMLWNINSV